MANTKWHRLEINECYLGRKHGKAYLVRMPSNSEYEGYIFWHPASLVRRYNDGTTKISFPDTWKFRLQANGGVLSFEIPASEFLAACPKEEWGKDDIRGELYTPLPMEPIENPVPDEELVDND